MRNIIIIIALVTILSGCVGDNNGRDSIKEPIQATETDPKIVNEMESQEHIMSSMGKVVAVRYVDLSFESALPIERVSVNNGQHVQQGQLLAQLDLFKLQKAVEQQQRAVEQAQLQMEQAKLQMQDVIINQGYNPDDEASVPRNVLHNAEVKSGYALSKSQLAMAQGQLVTAQHELSCGTLKAPFDGIVANISIQAHQLAQPGQAVCRVIDNKSLAVEFRVMEADFGKYPIGTTVNVVPVADKTSCYQAVVSEINPVVDQQGAVTIRARLSDTPQLFDGMNVEVVLKKTEDRRQK